MHHAAGMSSWIGQLNGRGGALHANEGDSEGEEAMDGGEKHTHVATRPRIPRCCPICGMIHGSYI